MKKFFEAAYKTVKNFITMYGERSIGAYSAQAAFFMFIALFPFAILLFYVISLLPESGADLSDEALNFIPSLYESLFSEAYQHAGLTAQTALISISALAALWAASKGIYAIVLGLDSVYMIKESRLPLFVRLRSTLYTLCFVVLLIAALGLIVFGNILQSKLTELFPFLAKAVFIVKSFRFIFLLVIFIGFFMLTYKFLPNKKLTFSSVFPGAVVASAGWLVFSFIYSLYIDNYNTEISIYGSLAAIVLLMIWLYFCMNILLSGALLNAWIYGNTIGSASRKAKTAK